MVKFLVDKMGRTDTTDCTDAIEEEWVDPHDWFQRVCLKRAEVGCTAKKAKKSARYRHCLLPIVETS